MSRKRYIARRVGDQYQLIAQSREDTAINAAWALGGGLLAATGIWRRSVWGAIAALAGGTMIYRGVTGRNPFRQLREMWHSGYTEPSETPSFAHDDQSRAAQMPEDLVEEAAMESFPASDPPASHRANSSIKHQQSSRA